MKRMVCLLLAVACCLGLAGCRLEDVEELTKPIFNKNWKGTGELVGTVYTLSEKWQTNHPQYTGWKVDGNMAAEERVRISAVKEGKTLYGYADYEGRIVVAPQYEDAGIYQEGYACVKQNGLWGLIDTAGNLKLECIYDGVYGVGEGRIAVTTLDTCVQYLDMRGKSRLRINHMYGGPFSDGYAFVMHLDSGKYGFIDTKGNIVIEATYDDVGNFVDGYAMVKQGSTVSVISKSGAVTGTLPGSSIGTFVDGYTLRYLSDTDSGISSARVYSLYDTFGQICGRWRPLYFMSDFYKELSFVIAPADETGSTHKAYAMDLDGNTYTLSLSDKYDGISYVDGTAFCALKNEDGTVTYHLYRIR